MLTFLGFAMVITFMYLTMTKRHSARMLCSSNLTKKATIKNA